MQLLSDTNTDFCLIEAKKLFLKVKIFGFPADSEGVDRSQVTNNTAVFIIAVY